MDQTGTGVVGRVPPKATIVTTGSELMLGQMVDTNGAWLSAWLSEKGVRVVRHVSVGDDLSALTATLAESIKECEVTLVTGGLGPTEDDLTRLAVARALGRSLAYHPELALGIAAFMEGHGYPCSSNNLRQAWLPEGASLVENPWGTAPAFAVELPGKLALFTPGVPQEMKNIVGAYLGDKLAETFPTRLGYHRTTVLRAAGLGESRVDDLIGDLVRGSTNPVLGFLAGPFETRILITSIAKDQSEADALEAPIIAEIVSRLGKNYVGRDEQTMLVAAASELKRRSLRLGLADSFTGGLAGQTFLRALDQDSLAGAISVTEKALPEAISFLFGQADADLVGVIQSAPESTHKTGPISGPEPRSSGAGPELTAKCRLLAKAPGGEVELASAVRTVGRNEAMATVRAGALLSLILWTHLTGGPGPH